MTLLANQAVEGLNVLHDQGVPNTLRGVGNQAQPLQVRPWTTAIAAATVVLLAALAIAFLVARQL